MRHTIRKEYYDRLPGGELEEKTLVLPAKWEICSCCRGKGKSSAYLGAFSAEEMREDPDFSEDYMNGFYDRACESCRGTGKVEVVDRDRVPASAMEILNRIEIEEDYAYRERQAELRWQY